MKYPIILAHGVLMKKQFFRAFVHIQKELEQISMAVEALQIWSERMIAEGKIDEKKYRKLMNQ